MLQGAATCRDSRQLRRRERGDGRGDVCEKATPVGVLRGRRRRVVHIHRFVVTHEGDAAAEGTPFDQCYRVRRRNGPRLRHRPVGDGMPTLCRGIPLAVSAQDSAFRKGVLDIDSRASNSHNIVDRERADLNSNSRGKDVSAGIRVGPRGPRNPDCPLARIHLGRRSRKVRSCPPHHQCRGGACHEGLTVSPNSSRTAHCCRSSSPSTATPGTRCWPPSTSPNCKCGKAAARTRRLPRSLKSVAC